MVKEIKRFLDITGMLKKYLLLLLLRIPFDALFTFLQAIFLKKAFDAIEKGNKESLLVTCILFGIASCFLFLYNGTVWRLFGAMYIQLGGKLRKTIIRKISKQPLRAIEENSKGDIMTRINQDAGMALQMLGGPINIPHLVVALFNIVISSVLLSIMNFKMLLLVWVFVMPHVLINQLIIVKPMTGYQREVQKATGTLTTVLSSMITSADTAILYDAQEFMMREYEKNSNAVFKARMKIIKRNSIGSALLPIFGLGGYLILLITGGNSIAKGNMSLGELTAIFQLRGGVLMSGMMFINSMVNLKLNLTGAIRVIEMTGGEKDV